MHLYEAEEYREKRGIGLFWRKTKRPRPTREFSSFNAHVGEHVKQGSYNSSRGTYFLLNSAYLLCASLNSLYIPLSVLPVVEISAALV